MFILIYSQGRQYSVSGGLGVLEEKSLHMCRPLNCTLGYFFIQGLTCRPVVCYTSVGLNGGTRYGSADKGREIEGCYAEFFS